MGQLVLAMTREWEVATHNATMATLREAEAHAASAAPIANGNAALKPAGQKQQSATAAPAGNAAALKSVLVHPSSPCS